MNFKGLLISNLNGDLLEEDMVYRDFQTYLAKAPLFPASTLQDRPVTEHTPERGSQKKTLGSKEGKCLAQEFPTNWLPGFSNTEI